MKKYLNPKQYKEIYSKQSSRSSYPSPMDYQRIYRGNVAPVDPHYIVDVPMARPTRTPPPIPSHMYGSHMYLNTSGLAFVPPIGPTAFYEAPPAYTEPQFVSAVPINAPYSLLEEPPAYESRSRTGSTTRPFIKTRNVNRYDPLLDLDNIYLANNINPYASVTPFERIDLTLDDLMINDVVERRTEDNRNRIIESPDITAMSQTPLPRSVFPQMEMSIVTPKYKFNKKYPRINEYSTEEEKLYIGKLLKPKLLKKVRSKYGYPNVKSKL
jgi:hypothetical protein